MLIDFLKLKNPKSKVLKEVGSTIKGKNKVKLPYALASMDKIKPPSNKLDKWIPKKFNIGIIRQPSPFKGKYLDMQVLCQSSLLYATIKSSSYK